MSRSPDVGSNRREFLRDAARRCALGVLAVLAGITGVRSRLGGQRCVNRGLCNGCNLFVGCGLPQALSAKLAKPGGKLEAVKTKS